MSIRLDGWDPIDRETLKVMLESGFLLGTMRRYDEAINVFSGVLSVFPENIPARLGLGNILCVQGRLKEAEDVYRSLVESAPGEPAPMAYLGELLIGTNRQKEGRKLLEKAASMDPTGAAGRMARELIRLADAGVLGAPPGEDSRKSSQVSGSGMGKEV